MAASYIELYETLKKDMSEESAKMIAEAIARGSEVATKADLEATSAALRSDLESTSAALRSDLESASAALRRDLESASTALRSDISRLEIRIERLDKDLSAKILRYFIPLWVAVFGALASMIALVIVKGP